MGWLRSAEAAARCIRFAFGFLLCPARLQKEFCFFSVARSQHRSSVRVSRKHPRQPHRWSKSWTRSKTSNLHDIQVRVLISVILHLLIADFAKIALGIVYHKRICLLFCGIYRFRYPNATKNEKNVAWLWPQVIQVTCLRHYNSLELVFRDTVMAVW